MNLNSGSERTIDKKDSWHIQIWTQDISESGLREVYADFLNKYPEYANITYDIKSFSDYSTYKDVLFSSFVKWVWPDIFTINNSDSIALIEERLVWISQDKLSPGYARNVLEPAIWNELIESYIDAEWKTLEVLKWVAPAYDTLVTYHNTRYTKGHDLTTWSWINSAIDAVKKKYPNSTPLAIWTWRTTDRAADIMTQIFMQEWIMWTNDLSKGWASTAINKYKSYWDVNWINGYETDFESQIKSWKWSFDIFANKWFFSSPKTVIAFWFIKDLETIKNLGMSKTYLHATSFPKVLGEDSKVLVDYNYYAINKDTQKYDLATDFMAYLASTDWARTYINNTEYKLPTNLDLIRERKKEKVDPIYNISYSDFYRQDSAYSSFDALIKDKYDEKIIELLDYDRPQTQVSIIRNNLVCKFNQVAYFTWLNQNCD